MRAQITFEVKLEFSSPDSLRTCSV